MSTSLQIAVLILLAVVAANLPFLSQRRLWLGPRLDHKSLGWRLLELVLMYLLVGGIGMALEQHAGQMAPQGWEFYAVTAAFFLTLAFPGFVYRYLLRARE